jgi:bifunctional non-homologous end joining protein LigD
VKSAKTAVAVDGRNLQFSNLDKVLWPRDGYTKGDLIAYYRAVAPWLLPYVKGRPLTLERYPNGIDEAGWWEKQIPRGLPDWVPTVVTDASTKR